MYRPPKVSTTFIHELSEFLSNQVSRCDRLLVLGDFNIHVCCPSKPMVKNFMSLMDSLNFVQSVSSPTHNRILDLVLTRGFSVHICEIFDAGISDHYPVVFEPVISYDHIKSSISSQDGAEDGSRVASSGKTLQFFVCFICFTC